MESGSFDDACRFGELIVETQVRICDPQTDVAVDLVAGGELRIVPKFRPHLIDGGHHDEAVEADGSHSGDDVDQPLENVHLVRQFGSDDGEMCEGHWRVGGRHQPRDAEDARQVNERRVEMSHQRQHTVAQESFNDNQIELDAVFQLQNLWEDGVVVEHVAADYDSLTKTPQHNELVVLLESDLVVGVEVVQHLRVQLRHVDDVFARFQAVPKCDRVSSSRQLFDDRPEEVGVAVRRLWRQEENVGSTGPSSHQQDEPSAVTGHGQHLL